MLTALLRVTPFFPLFRSLGQHFSLIRYPKTYKVSQWIQLVDVHGVKRVVRNSVARAALAIQSGQMVRRLTAVAKLSFGNVHVDFCWEVVRSFCASSSFFFFYPVPALLTLSTPVSFCASATLS